MSSSYPSSESASPMSSTSESPDSDMRLIIADVDPHQPDFTVKGRVTSKSDLHEWWELGSPNVVFGFDIQDYTAEIHVVAFKELAEAYADQIEVGQIYSVTSASVQKAEKKFTALPHEFKLVVNQDTVIHKWNNDLSCPQISYKWTRVDQVLSADPGLIVDVVAVILKVHELEKTPWHGYVLRKILLVDTTGAVTLNLWKTRAVNFDWNKGDAVLIRKAKVSCYMGNYMACTSSFSMERNPLNHDAFRLRAWYLNEIHRTQQLI